ncbi:DUF1579 domain-containing protein [bacterium BMS3Abin03]|jgi:hypothetical protein|nr:DUF1579 domain-containing protein [bacterium BMS3Abin03]MCG6960996.1 DUF1579 domain-containing protein [bacterium BMS3Abin03]
MLKQILTFLIILSLFLAPNMFSQDEDMAAQQQAWMEYMTPGPMHEMMAKTAGDWKTTIKYWMDSSGDPMVSEGTSKSEMILGGRYLKETSNSTVMGMPMEGISITGYDNSTKEFTSVWIDNMGTGTTVAKGTYDEETKTITLYGSMVDPMTGKDTKYREVINIVDDNHHVFEMYVDQDGQEVKNMEVEYAR